MKDPRWPANRGWVKISRFYRGAKGRVEIHFLYNTKTGKFADFKFN